MPDENFWGTPKEHSKIKIEIVSKFFGAWVAILAQRNTKLLYIDLFAGKGRYDDGYPSTCIRVIQHCLANELFRERVQVILNDADVQTAAELKRNVDCEQAEKALRFPPIVSSAKIDDSIKSQFSSGTLPPAFLFVDPFGSGVSMDLLKTIIRNPGTDAVLFFNYNFTNRFIDGENGEKLFAHIFGPQHLKSTLEELTVSRNPRDRERVIMNGFANALWKELRAYSVPFRIGTDEDTTYYLIGLSKHKRGYAIVKDIMAKRSVIQPQGVPMMEFNERLFQKKTLTELLLKPLDELIKDLPIYFQGRTVTPEDMLMEHGIGKYYVLKNYQTACAKMLAAGQISAGRKPARENTFAKDIPAIFPKL